jgi:hypothetical protein
MQNVEAEGLQLSGSANRKQEELSIQYLEEISAVTKGWYQSSCERRKRGKEETEKRTENQKRAQC